MSGMLGNAREPDGERMKRNGLWCTTIENRMHQ
jgi:hypothetical protein